MSLKFVGQSAALIGAFWVASAPAPAQTAPNGVLACRGIADDTARLACFDRESAQLAATASSATGSPTPNATAASVATASARGASRGASPGATPAAAPGMSPNTSASGATPPSLDPQQTFGLSTAEISAREVSAGARPREASSMTAHIARLAQGANGRFVFTLDNQQVWQELLAAGDLDSKPGDGVVISRGALGSYWMKAQSGRGAKVTRLR